MSDPTIIKLNESHYVNLSQVLEVQFEEEDSCAVYLKPLNGIEDNVTVINLFGDESISLRVQISDCFDLQRKKASQTQEDL